MKFRVTAILLILILFNSFSTFATEDNCDLVDHSEYKDLLTAVSSLDKQLRSIPACNTANNSQTDLQKIQQDLTNSSTKLQEYWSNPGMATHNPGDFGNSINTAISSISSITNTLQSGAAGNPNCAQALGKQPQILATINDVTANLAPMAMMASVVVPSLKAVIPWAIGATGVISIFNILATMGNQKTLDLKNNPEHRKLVLKGVCDYKKLKKNVDYLMLIQTGQVNSELNNIEQSKMKLKESVKGDVRLTTLIDKYFNSKMSINKNEEALQTAKDNLYSVAKNLSDPDNDKPFICNYIAPIIERNMIGKTFNPYNLLADYNLNPLGSGNESSNKYKLSIRLGVHKEIESILREHKFKKDYKSCAEATSDWLKSYFHIFRISSDILKEMSENLLSQLSIEPAFLRWSQSYRALDKDRQLLENVNNFMKVSSQRGSVISRADLSQQVDSLGKFIIGPKTITFSTVLSQEKSLVGEWLRNMRDLYAENEQMFSNQFTSLNNEANAVITDQLIAQGKISQYINVKGKDVPIKSFTHLEFLTSKDYNPKRNEKIWKMTCNQLNNLWLTWLSSKDYLNSIQFFCTTIDDLISRGSDGYVISTCKGSLSINPGNPSVSWLDKTTSTSGNINQTFSYKASVVNKKRLELNCPGPSRPN